jgi:hypothetical protein
MTHVDEVPSYEVVKNEKQRFNPINTLSGNIRWAYKQGTIHVDKNIFITII